VPDDIWESSKLLLFIAFFVPGFIARQIYGLFIAIDDSDISKQLPSIVAYSAIHYALTGWIILRTPAADRLWIAYLVVLVLPILWAPIILLLRDWRRWQPRILTWPWRILNAMLKPEATPWDTVFTNEARWVRIKLKSGPIVGGYLGPGSLVSVYPREQQIFIAREYTIDQSTGFFRNPISRTGLLINGTEIETIEIIELEQTP
jgi:hypothetical protein